MTAKDLALDGIAKSGSQMSQALKGLDEKNWDTPVAPAGMTVRQIVAHLAECYTAFLKKSNGKEHEWGTYEPADTSMAALLAESNSLRKECIAVVEGSHAPEVLTEALDFLILHDPYHVGQIVLFRLQVDPEWDFYSIYESA